MTNVMVWTPKDIFVALLLSGLFLILAWIWVVDKVSGWWNRRKERKAKP